jgi:hypothetical protein
MVTGTFPERPAVALMVKGFQHLTVTFSETATFLEMVMIWVPVKV